MRKIAVLGSDNAELFESIYKYFMGKNVDITVISDNVNSELLKQAKILGVSCSHVPYEENAEFFGARSFDLIVLVNYKEDLNTDIIELGKFLNIHPSLLPAFKGKDAIYRAFMSGVKVSGVTVHWITNEPDGGKILAQYPVLIGNTTHYDEFEKEIKALEKLLYPKVIDAVLNDKAFDFSDLFANNHCSSSGCENCKSQCGKNVSD